MAASRSSSQTVPGSTRAQRSARFISSTPCMYFDQSMTTATLQHWPARLVPPPRESTGAPNSPAGGDRLHHVFLRLGNDDADRHLAVVRGVDRIHAPCCRRRSGPRLPPSRAAPLPERQRLRAHRRSASLAGATAASSERIRGNQQVFAGRHSTPCESGSDPSSEGFTSPASGCRHSPENGRCHNHTRWRQVG